MSQLENKMDDFVPFGGQARTEYQEDELAIPHAVSAAAINALDELMFPKDDQGQWPSGCQTYFAVQRTSGPESEKDYFLLGGDGLVSCIDQIEDEVPYSRDGADWGESDKALAFKVYSEPPTLLTFHELAPNGIDLLRDDDGFVSDAPSEAVEKIFNDPLCTMPAILALTEVELKVEAAIIELEMEHDTGESLRSLATLLIGADVISTKSVSELLDTMAERFGLEPEERTHITDRAQAKEPARLLVPDIGVEIDSQNDDDFITGTVTVDGESCYFYCPNNNRNPSEYDSAILEPFRPVGFEGDIEDVDLPAAIEENRNIVELVVSVAAAPYMDPDKLPGCEQGLDSLCEEKIDEAQTLRYGMEGVGLPMLDAAEHLANY